MALAAGGRRTQNPATFSIIFPRRPKRSLVSLALNVWDDSVPQQRLALATKVLVVDDEDSIARTLTLILKQNGFCATSAVDGESAVRIATEWHPDILLSDIVMPGLNGYDAALQIRAVLPHCRVVLISGHFLSADQVRADARDESGFEFLPKPVHPSVLLAALQPAGGTAKAV